VWLRQRGEPAKPAVLRKLAALGLHDVDYVAFQMVRVDLDIL